MTVNLTKMEMEPKLLSSNNEVSVLKLYGVIGNYWDDLDAKSVTDAIDAIKSEEIHIKLSSPGGSVFAGMAILHALKTHPAKISIDVEGQAASMASLILMAAEKENRRIAPGSVVMVHNPWAYVEGNAKELRVKADLLEKITESAIKIYSEGTGISPDELKKLMDETTSFFDEEAVEKGFVGSVIKYDVDEKKLQGMITDAVALMMGGHNSKQDGGKIMTITVESLKKDHPEVAEMLIAEGRSQELNRVKSVKAQSIIGYEEMVEKMVIDGVTTGEQAAMAIINAERNVRMQAAEKQTQDSGEVPAVTVSMQTPRVKENEEKTTDIDPEDDEAMNAEWKKSASVRADFPNIDAYKAFMKAKSEGLIRMKGGK